MSKACTVALSVCSRLNRLRQLLLPGLLLTSIHCPAAITFMQRNSAVPQSPQSSVSVTYAAAEAAGDTNVVAIGWGDTTSNVTAVTDTAGNVYALAVGPTRQGTVESQSIYVAKNVAAAAANANTVKVTFSAAARYPDVRILSYRGLDTVSPVEAVAGATGTGATSSSGSLTTINANDLLFAANRVVSFTSKAGPGFTSRVVTSPDGDIAEDQTVTVAGTYNATATLGFSGGWVMQLVALKAAGAQPVAAAPAFTPSPGTYTSPQNVSLHDTTSGATIYYTTGGVTNPTTSSAVFNPATPIPVTTQTTVKAMAAASGFANSAVVTGAFTIQVPAAAAPTFRPAPGTYTSTQSVSLTDTTLGATIYYTTDGVTNPTVSSTVYDPAQPIQVSANTTIRAMAAASGFANSAVATGSYVIQLPKAATPTFSPVPGTYTATQSVSLTDAISGATIYYTTDGVTNPTTSSPVYDPAVPILVSANTTIRATAAASGFANSAVATGSYVIQLPKAATPTFSPAPGNYTSAQSVILQDAASGATIYYTTDGVTNPTTSSAVYDPAVPILVSANTTIKAIAVASGFANSAAATGVYTVGAPIPISFVQVNNAVPQSPQSLVTLAYTAAQTIGDTNIVVIGWSDTNSTVAAVTDTKGNSYTLAIGPARQGGHSQAIYIAPNIMAAAAGANSVAVTFSASVPYPDIRILEYRGLSPISPLDGAVQGFGSGTTSNSGSLTTASPNDLLFAANTVSSLTSAAGTAFTSRVITRPNGNIAEDRITTSIGTYNATATMSNGNWVMQLVALRAATSAPVAATPAFNPAPGTYTSVQSVSLLDAMSGATIYYTLDGTAPTTSSAVFNNTPIQVSANTTIQAMAVVSGVGNSAVATGAYSIQIPTAAAPMFNPPPGNYSSSQAVNLADATSGSTIYYTLDGNTPTTSSTIYDNTPIPVDANTTIRAMATFAGFTNSAVATGSYTIGDPGAAVPQLIQHVSSTNNRSNSFASPFCYHYQLPNPTIAGNAVVVGFTFGRNPTPSVTDDQNNSYTIEANHFDSANSQSIALAAAFNITAGVRLIHLCFSSDPGGHVQPVATEFANVTAVDGPGAGAHGTGTAVSAGSLTPSASGDLVYQVVYSLSTNQSSFTAGSQPNVSWNLLSADLMDGFAAQSGVYNSADAINPSVGMGASQRWVSAAVLLRSGAAGGVPSGMRIVRLLHENLPSNSGAGGSGPFATPTRLQLPSSGNLLVAMVGGGNPGNTVSSITDTSNNPWTLVPGATFQLNAHQTVQAFYAANASTSANLALTTNWTTTSGDFTIFFYDVIGAAASPLDTASGATGSYTTVGNFTVPFSITPSAANELIFVQTVWAWNTGAGLTAPDQLFDTNMFDGESESGPEPVDENNGWGHLYSSSTANVSFTWIPKFDGLAFGNWAGNAVAFKPAP